MRGTAVVVVVMVGALVVATSGLAWAAASVSFAPETNYEAGLSPFAWLTDWPVDVSSADFDGEKIAYTRASTETRSVPPTKPS